MRLQRVQSRKSDKVVMTSVAEIRDRSSIDNWYMAEMTLAKSQGLRFAFPIELSYHWLPSLLNSQGQGKRFRMKVPQT